MGLRTVQPDRDYISNPFHATTTTFAVPISEVIPDIKWVNEAIFSRKSEWRELLIKQDIIERSEQNSYEYDLVVNKEIGTASIKESDIDPIVEHVSTESELWQTRLMNIPTRGFCISANEERATAESYRYLYDPEEFETPEI